jgi:glycosyltransferase involved in cell wall biosynthesis
MTTFVSVVVPTYRRNDLLGRCLARLQNQSLDPSHYEVIVCDDAPDESTRELVQSLARPEGPALVYVPVTATQGPAGARNAGWRSGRGSIVAFTDDDCLPEPGWLAAGLAALAHADAATGRTVVPVPERPTDHERDTAGLATAEFITANCFCQRTALEEVGGFDERFTAAWREDSDLHFSLLERGKRIVKADDAVVVHPVRPASWGVSIEAQRKGVFDPLLWRKHPALYAQRIGPYPKLYYFAAAGIAFTPAGLFVRSPSLGIVGVALWLAVTLVFTERRLRGASHSVSHVFEMLFTSALIPPLSLFWRVVGILRFCRDLRSHDRGPAEVVAPAAVPTSAAPSPGIF